ncbi:MAG: DUF4340 domain-containing protein [Verrucomicrobia bacterium]|nr:MAG: DUF4340 domain-containing protein [Verrucomicrobiota bacterium]
MKSRHVTLFWILALVLAAIIAIIKFKQKPSEEKASTRSPGQTLLDSFKAADVQKLSIQGADATVNLSVKDKQWIVEERENYPANTRSINEFLRTVGELKITQAQAAGPSFAPRFGMDEASSVAADRGIKVIFKDSAGKDLTTISLGKSISSGSQNDMMSGGGFVGRYVRNHADESAFYATEETFPSIESSPKSWLDDAFIAPEKIKSIRVTEPDAETIAWEVTREAEEAEFKLVGATPDENLDAAASEPFKSLLSYAKFDDVLSAQAAKERTEEKGKRVATIVTFDGFTYTVTITPMKAQTEPPAALATPSDPQTEAKVILTIDVKAELAKERTKAADEKPEDAKSKDEAFAARLKELSEKLAKEAKVHGWNYEISKSVVESLLKDRASLIAKPTAEGADPNAGGVQNFPGGMIAPAQRGAPIEAVTPPISVPAATE